MKKIFLPVLLILIALTLTACGGGSSDTNAAPVFSGVNLNPVITEGDSYDPLSGVTVTDTEDGDLTADIVVTGFSTNNLDTPGSYTITLTVTDSKGKPATATINLTVEAEQNNDPDAPTIALVPNVVLDYTQGDALPDFTSIVTITDPVDGTVTVTTNMLNSTAANMNIVGTFIVTYTYMSTSGKSTSFNVTFRVNAPVDLFGNCDPNFPSGQTNLDLGGHKVLLGTWMRNFLDPYWLTAKPSELNNMKKTCIARANTEHNATLGWYAYDNALNHTNEIITQYITGDFKADFYNINSHNLGKLVEAGAIRPITPFLDYLPDFYQDINTQFGTYKGEVYGIWTERVNVNMGIYVNLDMIEEYGLTNPAELWIDGEWNWQALLDTAAVIKENAPANIEVLGINNYDLGSYLIGSNGGKTIDPLTDTFALTDPKAINALAFAQQLKERGYVWTAEDNTDTSTRAKFTSGELLMYFGSDWISGDPSILKPGEAVQFTLGMVPMPYGTDITDVDTQYRVPITVANLWVLRSDADDLEAEKLFQYFVNTVPWGDDYESDLRYTETMRDHMDDRTSLSAYVSASKLGYFEKTFLYDVVWGLPDSGSVGIGNIYAEIIDTAGSSVTAIIEAALPSIQAKIDEALGKND